MKITQKWIKKWEPCEEAVEWIGKQDTTNAFELIEILRRSDVNERYSWLFWAIPRLMKTKKDKVRFAIYCAELALPIFEEKYPNDKRPREAIQAAKDWLEDPSKKTEEAAEDAAEDVAGASRAASWAAARTAEAAAWAAWDAAGAAAWAAARTAKAAVRAARAAT